MGFLERWDNVSWSSKNGWFFNKDNASVVGSITAVSAQLWVAPLTSFASVAMWMKSGERSVSNPEKRDNHIQNKLRQTFSNTYWIMKENTDEKLNISDSEKQIYDNFYSEYLKINEKISSFNYDGPVDLNYCQNLWDFIAKDFIGFKLEYTNLSNRPSKNTIRNGALKSAVKYLLNKEKYKHLDENKVKDFINKVEDNAIIFSNFYDKVLGDLQNRTKKWDTNSQIGDIQNYILSNFGILNNLYNSIDNEDIDFNNPSIINELKQKFSDLWEDNLKTIRDMILNEYNLKGDIADKKYYILAFTMGINLDSKDELEIFKRTLNTDEPTKYRKQVDELFEAHNNMMIEIHEEFVMPYLTERYKVAQELAETRKMYGDEYIKLLSTKSDNSSTEIAANLVQWNQTELKWYKLSKSDINGQEDATLRYTAFDITFNKIFNTNEHIVQRLINLKIDLRSELSNYWIYNPGNNFINQDARNRFISEKLQNSWLTKDEINGLWEIIRWFTREVNKNYEILCNNFYCDQKDFEKISKIYALGEIIENIKKLFSRVNTEKLEEHMWLELDKDKPADIIGDCLFLKWKIKWTETNIKFDLRTGKLFMNSFLQQTFNPDKITIWNKTPDTEIWNLNSFENLLDGYNSISVFQSAESEGEPQDGYTQSNNEEEAWNSRETTQKKLEWLTKNKLLDDLKLIWKIVSEKAGEKWMENSTISDLLKTFNILPDNWDSDSIEFIWWSKLFILLESIKNTDNEDDLNKFSKVMWKLLPICGFDRWKNNIEPKSASIFDISEKTSDVISLQESYQNYFNDRWENKEIKGKKHFDSSTPLSFVNIIVEKCCINTPSGRKISGNKTEDFINPILNGIVKQRDEEDLAKLDAIIDDNNNWFWG